MYFWMKPGWKRPFAFHMAQLGNSFVDVIDWLFSCADMIVQVVVVISQEINGEYKQSTYCNVPANCEESEEVIVDTDSMSPLENVK